MSLPTFTITHKDDDTAVQTDISSDMISAPLVTDTGSGTVNSAVLILNAPDGKFITSAPIVDQFDQIKISITDGQSGTYTRVFEVRSAVPVESKGGGRRLELHMAGIEVNLMNINHTKPFYFTDAYTVGVDVGNVYGANKGTKQPTLLSFTDKAHNKLPDWTTNIYDYGLNEEKCYNRYLDIIDRLASSVDNGGVLDFFEIGFDAQTFDNMTLNIFSSGSIDNSIIIQDSLSVNQGDTEGGIDAFTGSLVCSWGANDQGSLPVDASRFASKEIIYPNYSQWLSTPTYPLNARVQWLNSVYKSIKDSPPNINKQPDTNPLYWQVRTKAAEYGDVIQYSPWTVGKRNLWKNSGAGLNASSSVVGANSMWDGNLVIWADDAERTWADITLNDGQGIANIPTKYLYGGSFAYRGFRILMLGSGTGILSGNDVNGKPFAKSVVEFDGSKYVVKYVKQTNLMCGVTDTGTVYMYDTSSSPNEWLAIDTLSGGNDCFHPYDDVINDTGVETDGTFTTNNNSAVAVTYSWNALGIDSTTANWYKAGAWLNFRFPYPHNTYHSISENVGQLYGGSVSTAQEPSTLDSQNMHLTHDGLRGFNHGSSSEDYGTLSAIGFWLKLKYTAGIVTANLIVPEGNFKMRCFIYDTSDNVVFQDFVIPFNNQWVDVQLPLGAFQVYRALKPRWSPSDLVVPPKQTSVLNLFEWKNIKQICIQTQESYDEEGRYTSLGLVPTVNTPSRYGLPILALPLSFQRKIILTIDSFRFIKPLFVTSGAVTDRNLEPDFLQRPNILFYDQLKSDADAELQKAQFRHKEYDVTTTMKFDINFGDTFYLRNSSLVSDSDNGANTIKLVAKRIEYSLTKPSGGEGGALRKIIGVKRFT